MISCSLVVLSEPSTYKIQKIYVSKFYILTRRSVIYYLKERCQLYEDLEENWLLQGKFTVIYSQIERETSHMGTTNN